MSSVAHEYGVMNWEDLNFSREYNSFKAYAQSKLANVLHGREMARRLQGKSDISVFIVHPGKAL